MTALDDLLLADPATVAALADDLAARHRVEALSVPRAGLALLQHADAVFDEPFHLGEVPLATAAVSVTASDGRSAQGAAAVMDDHAERATALAICDAVLRAGLDGADAVAALAAAGARVRADREARRAGARAATTVAFVELGQDDEDDSA